MKRSGGGCTCRSVPSIVASSRTVLFFFVLLFSFTSCSPMIGLQLPLRFGQIELVQRVAAAVVTTSTETTAPPAMTTATTPPPPPPCNVTHPQCNTSQASYGPNCECWCQATYAGPDCNRRVCHSGIHCNARGHITPVAAFPDCNCTCNTFYGGLNCEYEQCRSPLHVACSSPGTRVVGGAIRIGSGESAFSCYCICKQGYTGTFCETRICDVNVDCSGSHGLSVSGIAPNCSCQCKIGYEGPRCETRVCHRQLDCRGRGNVSGVFPHCECQCPKGFTGLGCRTITNTASMTSTRPSRSRSAPSNTHSARLTMTNASRSASGSFSHTATLTHSQRTSTGSVSPPSASLSRPSPTPSVTTSATATLTPSGRSLATLSTLSMSRTPQTYSAAATASLSLSTTCPQQQPQPPQDWMPATMGGHTAAANGSLHGLSPPAPSCVVRQVLSAADVAGVSSAEDRALVAWMLGRHHAPTPAAVNGTSPTATSLDGMGGGSGGGGGGDGNSQPASADDPCWLRIAIPYTEWGSLGDDAGGNGGSSSRSRGGLVTVGLVLLRPDLLLHRALLKPSGPAAEVLRQLVQVGGGGARGGAAAWEAVSTRAASPTVVFVTFAYVGAPTLTAGSADAALVGILLCPLPHGAPMTVTLLPEPAPRMLPPVVADLGEVLGSIGAAVGASIGSPSSFILVSIVASLRSMSRCEAADLAEALETVASPIGLSAGPADGGPHRGAVAGVGVLVATNLIVIALLTQAAEWSRAKDEEVEMKVEEEPATTNPTEGRNCECDGAAVTGEDGGGEHPTPGGEDGGEGEGAASLATPLMPPPQAPAQALTTASTHASTPTTIETIRIRFTQFAACVAVWGLPSALVSAGAAGVDTAFGSGLALVVFAPAGRGDVVLGALSLAAGAAYVGHVAWALWRCPLQEQEITATSTATTVALATVSMGGSDDMVSPPPLQPPHPSGQRRGGGGHSDSDGDDHHCDDHITITSSSDDTNNHSDGHNTSHHSRGFSTSHRSIDLGGTRTVRSPPPTSSLAVLWRRRCRALFAWCVAPRTQWVHPSSSTPPTAAANSPTNDNDPEDTTVIATAANHTHRISCGGVEDDTGGDTSSPQMDVTAPHAAAAQWSQRYDYYIVDAKGWRWLLVLELAVAGIISALDALATDDLTWCQVRLGIAFAVLLVFALVVAVLRPVNTRIGLGAAMVVAWLQAAVAAVLLANSVAAQSPLVELAADIIGVIATVPLAIASLLQLLAVVAVHRRTMTALLTRIYRQLQGLYEHLDHHHQRHRLLRLLPSWCCCLVPEPSDPAADGDEAQADGHHRIMLFSDDDVAMLLITPPSSPDLAITMTEEGGGRGGVAEKGDEGSGSGNTNVTNNRSFLLPPPSRTSNIGRCRGTGTVTAGGGMRGGATGGGNTVSSNTGPRDGSDDDSRTAAGDRGRHRCVSRDGRYVSRLYMDDQAAYDGAARRARAATILRAAANTPAAATTSKNKNISTTTTSNSMSNQASRRHAPSFLSSSISRLSLSSSFAGSSGASPPANPHHGRHRSRAVSRIQQRLQQRIAHHHQQQQQQGRSHPLQDHDEEDDEEEEVGGEGCSGPLSASFADI